METKEVVESTTQASEVLRKSSITGYAAFVKYSSISGWTHAMGIAAASNSPDTILPYGWYRAREDAIIAGSASYYTHTTIKILSAVFEF